MRREWGRSTGGIGMRRFEDCSVSIIIPVRDEWVLTRECVVRILQHTKCRQVQIILINNGSQENPPPFLLKHGSITWIHNPWNRGFASATNQGLRIATGDYLVCLNNDTRPGPHWLAQMIHVLQASSQCGMVGPVSNRVIPEQKIPVPSFHSKADIDTFTKEYNHTDSSKWRKSIRLSGFCLVFPRSIYEEIGEMDERYGLGTYEDDDYSYRVRKAGYYCMVAGDTYLHHYGSQSFQKRPYQEFKKLLKQNRAYFIRKWGISPPGERKGE